MLKFTKCFVIGTAILSFLAANDVSAEDLNSNSRFIILKIAEQPQRIVAENDMAQEGGMWDKTKEVSSDVWDGTKEVSSDVWDGAKKVTGDVWKGAKEVGSDVKEGLSGDDNTKTQSVDKKNKQ